MNVLDRLRGGLVVSVQAQPGSALDEPAVIAAIASAAVEAGAPGLRIAGERNLRAVRSRAHVPTIGIVKRRYPGYEPYITPTLAEVREVTDCAAEIVAFDATARERPAGLRIEQIVAAIHSSGALAMADCAQAADGERARAAGADILATTLCGYTKESAGMSLPAYGVLRDWRGCGAFLICEGGIHQPDCAARALAEGAHAIVVGTAITNTQWLVERFLQRIRGSGLPST